MPLLWLGYMRRAPSLLFLLLYTIITGGPFLWVALMSLRTTPEILDKPLCPAEPGPLGQVRRRLDGIAIRRLFLEQPASWSACAVLLVTLIGAMAAHCLPATGSAAAALSGCPS